jgi:hypothetical protein
MKHVLQGGAFKKGTTQEVRSVTATRSDGFGGFTRSIIEDIEKPQECLQEGNDTTT